jgi:hypothetical protein
MPGAGAVCIVVIRLAQMAGGVFRCGAFICPNGYLVSLFLSRIVVFTCRISLILLALPFMRSWHYVNFTDRSKTKTYSGIQDAEKRKIEGGSEAKFYC